MARGIVEVDELEVKMKSCILCGGVFFVKRNQSKRSNGESDTSRFQHFKIFWMHFFPLYGRLKLAYG